MRETYIDPNSGIKISGDPKIVSFIKSVCHEIDRLEKDDFESMRAVFPLLKEMHPDDGWINRIKNTYTPCYPRFVKRVLSIGSFVALQGSTSYRIVKIEGEVKSPFLNSLGRRVYKFSDTGWRFERSR